MDGYIGEVKMFGGTYPPENWAFCDGSLMEISYYSNLYSIIGIQFGGDGISTFNLPDLRGRIPVSTGYDKTQGQIGGFETVQLKTDEIPSHSHSVACDMKTATRSLKATPENNIPAKLTKGEGFGSDISGNTHMNSGMISKIGGSNHHENMQPWRCLNYIICVFGKFPPRS